jgi:hypothetical protein
MVTTKGDVAQFAMPGLRSLGLTWYLVYLFFSLLIHHTALFGWENFHFSYLFLTIIRILCSTLLNVMLIALVQVTFFNRKRELDS